MGVGGRPACRGRPRQLRSWCGLSFQACRYGHVRHLEHLLFYGADMGAQNASGNTALHVCALYNQVSEPARAPHSPRLCARGRGCAQRCAGLEAPSQLL